MRNAVLIAFLVALIGTLYAAAVLTWLLTPGDNPVHGAVSIAAYVGWFPVFGVAMARVVRLRKLRKAGRWHELPKRVESRTVKLWLNATIAVALTYALVVVALSLRSEGAVPPGQPIFVEGGYFLDNHGISTPITMEEYLHYLEIHQRGNIAVILTFYGAAVLMLRGGAAARLSEMDTTSRRSMS